MSESRKLGVLSDLATITMGQSPLGETYNSNGDGTPLINGPTEFDGGRLVKTRWTTSPTKVSKANDLIICVRGNTVGRIAVADGVYCLGRGVAAIRALQGKAIQAFVNQSVKNSLSEIVRRTNGSTFPNIDGKALSGLPTPIVSLPEQHRIADILATWDEAIDRAQKLETLAARRFSALIEDVCWATAVRCGAVHQPLSSVLTMQNQRVGNKVGLTVYSVTRGGLVPQETHFRKRISNEDISRHIIVRKGDLALSGLNFWLGSVDVSLSDEPICISPDYKTFRLSDKLDPLYFRYVIRTTAFREILKGSAVERASIVRKNFDRETFLASEIPLPALAEQRNRGQALRTAELLVEISRKRCASLRRQRDALASELLTGVPDAAGGRAAVAD